MTNSCHHMCKQPCSQHWHSLGFGGAEVSRIGTWRSRLSCWHAPEQHLQNLHAKAFMSKTCSSLVDLQWFCPVTAHQETG